MPAQFVLMPGDWPEETKYLARPIVGNRQGRPEALPWVAVARPGPDGRPELLARGGLDAADARVAIDEAEQAGQQTPVDWRMVSEKGFALFKRPTQLRAVVSVVGGGGPFADLASEQVLNRAAMLRAAKVLGGDQQLAIVPRRGWLLVRRFGGLRDLQLADQAARPVFERSAGDGISPVVLFINDGVPAGVNIFEGDGGVAQMGRADDAEWLL